MNPNPTNKHKAILEVKVTVYEIDELGQCTHLVPQSELVKFDLKSRMILTSDGFDKSDCLNKLRVKLDEFRKN